MKIIGGVVKCIATKGVEHLNYETVGKLVRMRPSHVAYYFPKKEMLLGAAVQSITAMAQKITIGHLEKAANADERLNGVVNGAFEWSARFPTHVSVMFLFYYYGTVSPQYRALHTRIRDAGQNRIASILKEDWGDRPNILKAAQLIQSVITGNIIQYYTCEPTTDLESFRKRTLESVLSIKARLL